MAARWISICRPQNPRWLHVHRRGKRARANRNFSPKPNYNGASAKTQGALSIVLYVFSGLFDAHTITSSLLMGLPFTVALAAGAFWFHGTSDLLYRRAAYVIIAAAALVSLPLFDALH